MHDESDYISIYMCSSLILYIYNKVKIKRMFKKVMQRHEGFYTIVDMSFIKSVDFKDS